MMVSGRGGSGWRFAAFGAWSIFPHGHDERSNTSYAQPAPGSLEERFLPAAPRRTFSSTEHLSPEAVAAYVDGELAMGPHLRASAHIAQCGECRDQIHAQSQARAALRRADPVGAPASLLSALARIPTNDQDVAPGFPVAAPSPQRKRRRKRP
ncbi:zf-HC2 domain-containing protein [Lolliginicoccus lacisalsi]|uniref:zf-HC2 domain-containing protein n=1 Tax=Lolliginicoccus lacisalsi TaxID=2742202 RepID=UPI001CDB79D2|nr:zf-HC2 domain-containing protein [Lolliginicoccus lacisalsi]